MQWRGGAGNRLAPFRSRPTLMIRLEIKLFLTATATATATAAAAAPPLPGYTRGTSALAAYLSTFPSRRKEMIFT